MKAYLRIAALVSTLIAIAFCAQDQIITTTTPNQASTAPTTRTITVTPAWTGQVTKTSPATQPATPTRATSIPTTAAPQVSSSAATQNGSGVTNCTNPEPVSNAFNISGVSGWSLVSHDDYQSNSMSKHWHNLFCQWTIPKPDSGLVLLIRIFNIDLEHSTSCDFDYLNFKYVDYNSSLNMNVTFCGPYTNRAMTSRSGVNITFRTDPTISYRGFHLLWAFVTRDLAVKIQATMPLPTNCSQLEEIEQISVGDLTAPGSRLMSDDLSSISNIARQSTYKSNMNCEWKTGLRSQYTLVWIQYIQLEYGPSASGRTCPYDNLTLSFSNAITGRFQNSTFCALTAETIYLANSSVTITFKSDSTVESRGFFITFIYINETQIASALNASTWRYLANSSVAECSKMEPISNLTLSGVGSYRGGRLLSHTEFLTVVNSSYHPNMNCTWTVSPPNNSTLIHLTIYQIDLETGTGSSSVCRYDNLTFLFRNAINGRWENRVACRSLQAAKFTSNSEVTIRFTTDHSIAKRGFHLEWVFVPLEDAPRIPEWENLQLISCPREVEDPNGWVTLTVASYQPNTHCVWRWIVPRQEKIELQLRSILLDPRDDFRSIGFRPQSVRSCRFGRFHSRLTVEYLDEAASLSTLHFCGSVGTPLTITAYEGPVVLTFISDETSTGIGFLAKFTRSRIQRISADCPRLQTLNSHQSQLVGSWTGSVARKCQETISPKDANHAVKITINRFSETPLGHRERWPSEHQIFPPQFYPYPTPPNRYFACSNMLSWSSNKTVQDGALLQAASQVYENQPGYRNFTSTMTVRRNVCPRQGHLITPHQLSLGPIKVQIESSRTAQPLQFEIMFDQIPVVLPGSLGLCPKPTVSNTKQSLAIKMQHSRLISVKKMLVKAPGDCRASVRFDEGPFTPMSRRTSHRGNQIMIAVNCSSTSGKIFAVVDYALNAIECNSIAQLNWTNLGNPILLEGEGTQGFTALLEQIKWIYDGDVRCPVYNPSKDGKWIGTLRLFHTFGYEPVSYYNYGLVVNPGSEMFFCQITLKPPTGYDLIMQLQVYDDLTQICALLSQQREKPQLRFIVSSPGKDDSELSLCDHDTPGRLKFQERIRIASGSSVTVDLVAVPIYMGFRYILRNYTIDNIMETRDLVLLASQVESCQSVRPEAWLMNPDRTELSNRVTVSYNNTQTDCKLQVNADEALRLATSGNLQRASNSADQCWELRLGLTNLLKTNCGHQQLSIVTSYWDQIAGAVVHQNIQVCDTTQFSLKMIFLQTTEESTGLSLYYNGVRSGFVAEFTLTACKEITMNGQQNTLRFCSASSGGGSLVALIIAVSLLTIAIVCTILFAFRGPLLDRGRDMVMRARGTHRLSYTTGSDGVSLVED